MASRIPSRSSGIDRSTPVSYSARRAMTPMRLTGIDDRPHRSHDSEHTFWKKTGVVLGASALAASVISIFKLGPSAAHAIRDRAAYDTPQVQPAHQDVDRPLRAVSSRAVFKTPKKGGVPSRTVSDAVEFALVPHSAMNLTPEGGSGQKVIGLEVVLLTDPAKVALMFPDQAAAKMRLTVGDYNAAVAAAYGRRFCTTGLGLVVNEGARHADALASSPEAPDPVSAEAIQTGYNSYAVALLGKAATDEQRTGPQIDLYFTGDDGKTFLLDCGVAAGPGSGDSAATPSSIPDSQPSQVTQAAEPLPSTAHLPAFTLPLKLPTTTTAAIATTEAATTSTTEFRIG